MCDFLSFVSVFMLLVSASSEAKGIIYFQAANISILRDVKHALHFAKFVKHPSKYLQVTPLVSSLTPNEKKCQVWCVENLRCLSLNVAVFPDSLGKFKCELLATDMFNSSSNMAENMNYNHYSLKTKCHDKPCQNNGRCVANYTTNTYSCQCQCPYYRYNCEKVLAQTWSSWSNCSFHHRCPDYARRRVKTYALPEPPFANPCPDNAAVGTEIQNCPTTTPTDCGGALGMQDGRIKNSQITASSHFNSGFAPWFARLHRSPSSGDKACWGALHRSSGEYLQIDLGAVKTVTKVATQGRSSNPPQYTAKYSLAYSGNSINWVDYPGGPCIKEFTGNTDQNTVVTNVVASPIKARYIRIIVKTYYDHPVLRCELYGC